MKLSLRQWNISRWTRSTLGRFILFTLLLLIITLLAAGTVSRSSQAALHNEIIARNSFQVAAAAEQLAISLDKTMDMQRELLYDKDINRLGVVPGYYATHQKTLAMLRVMDRMAMLKNSSPLIRQASFMAPSIGRTITADGVDSLSSALFSRCNELCINQTQALIEMDGSFCIMMAYPTYNYYLKDNGASYLLCLELDVEAISSFLSAHVTMENGALFLFSDDGKLVASVNPQGIPHDADEIFTRSLSQINFDMTSSGQHYLVSGAVNTTSTKTLRLIMLQPHSQAFSVLQEQSSFFIILITLIIIANLAFVLYLWHVIHKPLAKLSEAFLQVEQGDFSLRIHHNRHDDFADIYQRFNKMNSRLGELIEQVYMQTIRTQRAELKQLQSQINPHFLYNNLFMIRSLAQLDDTETIEVLSAELGAYFRYMTRLGKQEVSLLDEVTHAHNYALIQDMRFSSRIRLDFPELPEELHGVTVPRLILQPLIENAYEHGLHDTASSGLLQVSYVTRGNDVLIIVEDNGAQLTDEAIAAMTASLSAPEEVQETTGLINIHRRLQLRFSPEYGLAFHRSTLGGLKVIMRIPLRERSEDHAQSPDRR